MKLSIFIAIASISSIVVNGQQLFTSKTIWETLNTIAGNQTFFKTLNEPRFNHTFQHILSNTTSNHTFLLPTEQGIQLSITNNLFSTTNTTTNEILYHILTGRQNIDTLLSKRHYLDTLSKKSPLTIITPDPQNKTTLQVLAGPAIANIIGQHYECSNGVIYIVDRFLLSPFAPMDTISFLPELQSLENAIKVQNLTNIVSNTNKTIFAPVDAAWATLSGSGTNLPFGTIIHNLKYQVIEGVYYQQDLQAKNYTLTTDYMSTTLQTESYVDGSIVLIGGGKEDINGVTSNNIKTRANIIRTDILTTGGVIHLIDKIIPIDSLAATVSLIDKSALAANNDNSLAVSISSATSSLSSSIDYSNFILHCIILSLLCYYYI